MRRPGRCFGTCLTLTVYLLAACSRPVPDSAMTVEDPQPAPDYAAATVVDDAAMADETSEDQFLKTRHYVRQQAELALQGDSGP